MLNPNYDCNPYKRPFDVLLKDKKNLIGAEIGVYRGQHVKEMLISLDIKKLYLIDSWEYYSKYNEEKIKDKISEAYADAKELLKEFNDGKLVWIKDYSIEAVKKFKNNSLDFVYIDANHAYEFVKQDIEVWLPKVKVNGLIGGHDYDNKPTAYIYGVKKAVDEYCKKNNIKLWSEWGSKYYDGSKIKDWGFIKI